MRKERHGKNISRFLFDSDKLIFFFVFFSRLYIFRDLIECHHIVHHHIRACDDESNNRQEISYCGKKIVLGILKYIDRLMWPLVIRRKIISSEYFCFEK